MGAAMTPEIALIVCRVILGPMDANDAFTGHRPSEWDTAQGVMHCRRQVIQLYDPSVDMGAAPQPFNPEACKRAAMMLGPQFDAEHRDKPWRFWRAACPVPTIDLKTGKVLSWTTPPCPESHGTVLCEVDSAI